MCKRLSILRWPTSRFGLLVPLLAVIGYASSCLAQEPAAGIAIEKQQQAEAEESGSVAPGINENFLDPNLDVQEWIDRFEVESREVYQARDEVLRQIDLKPGERVADIGAGTGFYSLLFAEAVGPQGWVYAVDISPRFVEHLATLLAERDVKQATPVLCGSDSVRLAPDSVDAAFICDAYHHFEFPNHTISSLFSALRPGGRLIVIDFERIPGVSREWVLGHVRAGKQTFIDEIEAVGFQLTAEREIPGFEENYFLEFRRPEMLR